VEEGLLQESTSGTATMISNEQLEVLRQQTHDKRFDSISGLTVIRLLELIDFQNGIISDMRTESSAFDLGVQEGEKKVLEALENYFATLHFSQKFAAVRKVLEQFEIDYRKGIILTVQE